MINTTEVKKNPTTKNTSREEYKTLLPLFATERFCAIRNNRFVDLLWAELDDSEKRAIYLNMFDPCGLG